MHAPPPGSLRTVRPRASIVAALAVAVAIAAGGSGVPVAAAAAVPKPTIRSFAAAPKHLAAAGGPVRLAVRVGNAATCTFRGQSAAFTRLNRVKTVSCARGRATVVLTVSPNVRTVPATIHYYVRATTRGRSVQRALTIVEAAAPAADTVTPPVTPLQVDAAPLPGGTIGVAYSATLSATGGTAPYTWSVASGSLPAGLSLSLAGTISGTPAAAGTFAFSVEVADSALHSVTADLSLVVAATVRDLAVDAVSSSSNWSGYSLDGGPFTSVTGTFTVPSLTNPSHSVNTSEWVGLDGASQENRDLIQAGVAETYSPFGGSSVYAWWEILPAAETRIDMAVQSGDTVAVTIAQVSPGQWSIRIVNVTSGVTFTTTQAYTGRGVSVEWVVEAPTGERSRISTLGQYTPPVTFTNLGWGGPATSFAPIEMRQNGATVSTPSALSSGQSSFAVAYGDTAPPAPG